MAIVTSDFETSIFNKGNAFDKRNFAVSYHFKFNDEKTQCSFYDEPDFITKARKATSNAELLIFHNGKFDCHWLNNIGITVPSVPIWDTMVAEYILSGQTSKFASLNDLCELYGLPKKLDRVAEYWEQGISTEFIPRPIVEEYGNFDVDLSYQVYLKQLDDPRMTEKIKNLILLCGQDLLVLQEMEYNGLKFNKEKAIKLAEESNAEIDAMEKELLGYGNITELNFDSDDQLSAYLYGGSWTKEVFTPETSILKSGPNKGKERTINRKTGEITIRLDGFFDPIEGTQLKKEGLYSSAEDVLKQLKAPTKLQKRILGLLLKRAKLSKLCGTYYEGLSDLIDEMHWDDLHPSYHQVVTKTGRLSSSSPNGQNVPPEADYLLETRYEFNN